MNVHCKHRQKSRFDPITPGVPATRWRCDHCGDEFSVADIAVRVMTAESYERLNDCKPGDIVTIEYE